MNMQSNFNQTGKVEVLENPKYYLALAALFRDESRFLKEWIEFYKLMGVEHFYLYNHLSKDNYMEVLKTYVQEKVVELDHLTYEPENSNEWYALQQSTYLKICSTIKNEVEWLVIVDTDEFLYPVSEKDITTVLRGYDNYASLSVNWRIFGSNGIQRVQDNELLLEKLVKRDSVLDLQVKTIIKPRYVESFNTPHFAVLQPGHLQITENYNVFFGSFSPSPSNNILTINHYSNRDLDFFFSRKLSRVHMMDKNLDETQKALKIEKLVYDNERFSSTYDEGILKFVPALRAQMFKDKPSYTLASKFIDLPHNKKIFPLPNNLVFIRELESNVEIAYSLLNGYGAEPYLLRKIMAFSKPNETYVEVGTNYGEIALQISNKLGTEGKVYAFEPDYNLFQYFSTSILINNISNIILHDHVKDLDLYFHHSNVDVIRINVAGDECNILNGAKNIIDFSNSLRIFIKWQSNTTECLSDLLTKGFILIDLIKFNEECSLLSYQQNYRLSLDNITYSDEVLIVREKTFQKYRQYSSNQPECIALANKMMFHAVTRESIEEVRYALSHKAEVNYYDDATNSPALYYAININNSEIISLLLSHGADVELGYYKAVTPLWQAAKLGYDHIVEILLSYNANKDFLFFNTTPAKIAADNGHTKVVQLLSEGKTEYKLEYIKINNLLYDAVIENNIDSLKSVITLGADLDYMYSGGTALYLAVERGLLEITKMLLEAGANRDIKAVNNETPLTISTQNHNFDMVKLLIESGANLEKSNGLGATSLFIAAYFGYDNILQLLLEYGANKDVQVQGFSAFQAALQEAHTSTAMILAGSNESFCQQIQKTEYEIKYADFCGEIQIDF